MRKKKAICKGWVITSSVLGSPIRVVQKFHLLKFSPKCEVHSDGRKFPCELNYPNALPRLLLSNPSNPKHRGTAQES